MVEADAERRDAVRAALAGFDNARARTVGRHGARRARYHSA
jgi:hypothetical protein